MARQRPKPGWQLKHVEEVPEGCCFVKRTGTFAYLRISEASARHLGLSRDKVYGVCYNGNVAGVDRGKYVWHVPLSEMQVNRDDQLAWERMVGCTEYSPEAIGNASGEED